MQIADDLEPETGVDPPPIIGIPWEISDVIEHIHVSPYAPEWYRDVVEDVLAKFEPQLVTRLRWSFVRGVPLY